MNLLLLVANIVILCTLCFFLGSVLQKRRSLDETRLVYFHQVQFVKTVIAELGELDKLVRLEEYKFQDLRARADLEMKERLVPIAQLCVFAEQTIQQQSGVEKRIMVEKLSDLMQPILGFSQLSEKLLKKIYIGKDPRMQTLRGFVEETRKRSDEVAEFIGGINIFNAPIKKRDLVARTQAR